MKYVAGYISLLLLLAFRPADGIYDITIKTIDGQKIELSQYKGKKLLFILLPLSAQDATVSVNDLAQLQTKYQGSLVVIGIPAEEAGYKKQDADKLKKMCREAGANIIIAEGMKTKKGAEQSSLFQWLTNKDLNRHFDQDAAGVGSKFFIDENGELYAVLGPRTALSSPLMDRVVTRATGKSNPEKQN
jgi:glutathione peroxidase